MSAETRGSVTAVQHSSSEASRFLRETDVDLLPGSPGTCQLRTSLDTLYTGEETAHGVIFSVRALVGQIEIQGFEFANLESVTNPVVKIYGRPGSTFSSDRAQWTELSRTTAVKSPDGLGAISPRADMVQSILLEDPGEEYLIYFTLNSASLQVADTGTEAATGSAYESDDILQLNVGEAIEGSNEFVGARTQNRAFQGKLHYRVKKACNTLGIQTELSFPFAAEPGTDRRELNAAVSAGFQTLLTEEADLARWRNVHGLSIDGVELRTKGERQDCTEFGFDSGCELYESDLQLGHYESLGTRELTLEFLAKLNNRNGLGELENALSVVYIGDDFFQIKYDILLTGVPLNTILNPFQRDYLEDVTFDFLDEFSDAVPYRVEISQGAETERRALRNLGHVIDSLGGTRAEGGIQHLRHRDMQTSGILRLGLIIFGIGDLDEFVTNIERALIDNKDQFLEEVKKRQFLPSAVNDNDETNFGEIFANLLGLNVQRTVGGGQGTTSTSDSGGLSSRDIQIYVYSAVAALSFLWLVYRVMKDCILVERGFEIKNEKLSDKLEQELENMDKPKQKPSRESITALNLDDLQKANLGAQRVGREAPKSRGVGRAKSSDDLDFFKTPLKPSSSSDLPSRGVKRMKSSDADSVFSMRSREPTRGVARTKSADVDLLAPRGAPVGASSHSRNEPSRGVARTKSNDLNLLRRRPSADLTGFGPKPKPSRSRSNDDIDGSTKPPSLKSQGSLGQRGRAAPTSRGVRKAGTFSGIEGFLGRNPTVGKPAPRDGSAAPKPPQRNLSNAKQPPQRHPSNGRMPPQRNAKRPPQRSKSSTTPPPRNHSSQAPTRHGLPARSSPSTHVKKHPPRSLSPVPNRNPSSHGGQRPRHLTPPKHPPRSLSPVPRRNPSSHGVPGPPQLRQAVSSGHTGNAPPPPQLRNAVSEGFPGVPPPGAKMHGRPQKRPPSGNGVPGPPQLRKAVSAGNPNNVPRPPPLRTTASEGFPGVPPTISEGFPGVPPTAPAGRSPRSGKSPKGGKKSPKAGREKRPPGPRPPKSPKSGKKSPLEGTSEAPASTKSLKKKKPKSNSSMTSKSSEKTSKSKDSPTTKKKKKPDATDAAKKKKKKKPKSEASLSSASPPESAVHKV